MRFYTASKLGSKRAFTKEGFLVCLDVPIARTGEMIYVGSELPELEAGPDGLIRVLRDPDAVFDPVAMASFLGMATTNDHPPEMVSPENYRRFTAGSALNVRRGNAGQDDLLFADLMFLDASTIAAILAGKDEISCGYDAEYEPVAPGVYRQVTITGNHVAVVAEGRCGARCAIGDSAAALQTTEAADAVLLPKSAPSCGCGGGPLHHHDAEPARPRKRTRDMAKAVRSKLKGSMLDRLRRTFQAKDEAGFEEAMTAVEEAAEMTEEEQAQAQLADMIGSSIATAIAPLLTRQDDVDAYITDMKAKDAKAATDAKAARDKAVTDKAAKDKAAKTKDDGDLDPTNYSGEHDVGGIRAGVDAENAAGDGQSTNDNDAVAAFAKARGLTDEDIATMMAMLKGDEPAATIDEEGMSEEDKAAAAKAAAEKAKAATTDSVSLTAEFRDTVAKAEILAPGVRLPSFDAKAAAKTTNDSICALRRRALKSAFDSDDRKMHVAPFVDAAPDFSKMPCDAIKFSFAGAAELAKRGNAPTMQIAAAGTRDAATRSTIDGMNAAAKTLWGNAR